MIQEQANAYYYFPNQKLAFSQNFAQGSFQKSLPHIISIIHNVCYLAYFSIHQCIHMNLRKGNKTCSVLLDTFSAK